jgi:hypothetical protein
MAPLLSNPREIHDNVVVVKYAPRPLEPMLLPLVYEPTVPHMLANARIPKRRALLIGICYNRCGGDLGTLKGPHKDVTDMKQLLMGALQRLSVGASLTLTRATQRTTIIARRILPS